MNWDVNTSKPPFKVEPYAATVFLIGGRMTLQDGSVVDSRQTISGDPADYLLQQAMSRSEDWWKAAKELADLIMADSGETSWTLAWAPRAVTVIKPDGTAGSRQIRTILGPDSCNLFEFQQRAHDVVSEGSRIDSQETMPEQQTISATIA